MSVAGFYEYRSVSALANPAENGEAVEVLSLDILFKLLELTDSRYHSKEQLCACPEKTNIPSLLEMLLTRLKTKVKNQRSSKTWGFSSFSV